MAPFFSTLLSFSIPFLFLFFFFFFFKVLLAILAIVHIERRTFAFWAYRLGRRRSGILDGHMLTNFGLLHPALYIIGDFQTF